MGKPFMARFMAGGLLKPKSKILGIDLAGTVEAVGTNTTLFQPGDEVFGSTGHGCFAEYACVREDEVQPKPANLTFEDAAVVGAAASTALHGLRDASEIKPGQKVQVILYEGRIQLIPINSMSSKRGFLKGISTDVQRDEDRV